MRGAGKHPPETSTLPDFIVSDSDCAAGCQPSSKRVPLTSTWNGPASKRQRVE